MGLYGSIQTMAISDMLGWIGMGKKTGSLTLNTEQVTKKIYITDGDLVHATSTLYSEQLSNNLIKNSFVKSEVIADILAQGKLTERDFGLMLLDRGHATIGQLSKCATHLVEQIFFSIFAFNEGVFLFVDEAVPFNEIFPSRMGLTNMIMEGARQADELIRIKDEMKKYRQAFFRVPKDKKRQFGGQVQSLGPHGPVVAGLLKGSRTLEDIIQLSPEDELLTLTTIKKLMDEKFLVPKKKAEAEETPEEHAEDLVAKGDIFHGQGRLGEAVRNWAEALVILPHHDIKEKYQASRDKYVASLRRKVGSPRKKPFIHPEVGTAGAESLLIPSEYIELFETIDGTSNLDSIAKETGMELDDLYIGLNRLLEMGYVSFPASVAK